MMVQSQTQQQQYLQVTIVASGQAIAVCIGCCISALAALTSQYLLLQALVLERCSDLLVVLGLQLLPEQLEQWPQQALSLLDKRCHRIFSEANYKHVHVSKLFHMSIFARHVV